MDGRDRVLGEGEGMGLQGKEKRKGGSLYDQGSHFRESFVTKVVNNLVDYRDILCEERAHHKSGRNQERKISFCRGFLTRGI